MVKHVIQDMYDKDIVCMFYDMVYLFYLVKNMSYGTSEIAVINFL